MSLDTLGLLAAQDLHAAASEIDVERSLQRSLSGRRRGRAVGATVLLAAVVAAVVVGWLATHDFFGREQSAPPLDSGPAVTVGDRLSVPVTLTVPEGWEVMRDDRAVELAPANGSDARIVVCVPRAIYQPGADIPSPLREDLVVWTLGHPDLRSTKFGFDGTDWAWTGTTMTLQVSPRSPDTAVPLVPLAGSNGPEALTVRATDRTFLWDLVYLTDSPPLVLAASSTVADDPNLDAARDELWRSLQVNPPPH